MNKPLERVIIGFMYGCLAIWLVNRFWYPAPEWAHGQILGLLMGVIFWIGIGIGIAVYELCALLCRRRY